MSAARRIMTRKSSSLLGRSASYRSHVGDVSQISARFLSPISLVGGAPLSLIFLCPGGKKVPWENPHTTNAPQTRPPPAAPSLKGRWVDATPLGLPSLGAAPLQEPRARPSPAPQPGASGRASSKGMSFRNRRNGLCAAIICVHFITRGLIRG